MAKKKLPPGVRERNGRYTFRFGIIDPVSGDRIQKETPSFPSAKEAYEQGIRIRAQLLDGSYVDEKNVSFSTWCDQWIDLYEKNRKVKKTTVRLRKAALVTLKKYFGGLKVKDVTELQFQNILNTLHNSGKSKSTLVNILVTGRFLFREAVKKKLIINDPTNNTVLPVRQETFEDLKHEYLPEFLEKEELKKFLSFASKHGMEQDFEIFTILAYTGMRIGEFGALQWDDVNREEKTIDIYKTLHVLTNLNDYFLGTPKNGTRRIISYGKTVAAALDRQEAWIREFKMANRKTFTDNNFIFVSPRKNGGGLPITDNLVNARMKRLLNLAELPEHLTPHSLRHTFTSLMAEAGESLEVIQKILGHRSDEVTRSVYLHVTKKQLEIAPNRFERVMDN